MLDGGASPRDVPSCSTLKTSELLLDAARELKGSQSGTDSPHTRDKHRSDAEEQHYRSLIAGFLRRIPSNSPSPVLAAPLSLSAKRTVARWYFGRSRLTIPSKRYLPPPIKRLLEAQKPSPQKEYFSEDVLSLLHLTHARPSNPVSRTLAIVASRASEQTSRYRP